MLSPPTRAEVKTSYLYKTQTCQSEIRSHKNELKDCDNRGPKSYRCTSTAFPNIKNLYLSQSLEGCILSFYIKRYTVNVNVSLGVFILTVVTICFNDDIVRIYHPCKPLGAIPCVFLLFSSASCDMLYNA